MPLQTFVVQANNEPGELVKLMAPLAAQNVNITICALGWEGQGVAGIITSDPAATETILRDAGYDFTSYPAIAIQVPDQPGQVEKVAQLLGDQGVNVQCFFPATATPQGTTFIVGTDNIEAATKALGDWQVDYTYS